MAEFPHFRQKMEDTSHNPFSSSAAASMNFSMGRMHPQQAHSHGQPPIMRQTFSQVHASANASSIGARNAGRRPEAGNMQDGINPQMGHGHPGVHASLGLNHQQQQQNHQNHQNHLNLQQFMEIGQVHMLSGDGASGGAGKGGQFAIGDPNLHAALADIQQKINKMQEIVRMNGEGVQTNLQQQQQVASAVSLISQVTAAISEGMLNQNQTQNLSMSDSSQLSHLFGACSSSTGFNFFDHPGSSPVNADMVVGNNNAFSSLPGRMGGNNHDQNTNNLNALGHGQSSMSGTPSATAGDPIFGHGAVTTGSGSSVHPSETVGVGNLRQPPPFNNRMAARPGAGSGMNGSGKASINRSSPGVMVPSNSASGSHGSEDQEMGVRSRGGASRDDFDDGEGENLVDGSYQLVELDDQEILAEHTHFCNLCGKGFKRDANLRMHMRSHGDEYKTPEALARPQKPIDEQTPEIPKRFSCPHVGCKRNVKHRKFQPLKSLLCVKNHYRRSHCAKNLACSKCKVKKFSVVADLKTHEKHCGCDKWQCSCGTTFSRKDKLFGHVSLFVGHSPAALPLPENLAENSAGSLEIVDMAPVGSNVDSGLAESTSMVQQGLDSQVSGGYVNWTHQLF
ncbi:protein MpIDDL5 [Marchantia polymorpha subsp. ruderalis]|nr:hypothetical protein MARPO_0083s0069 [Marchantia polymorpha]BBN19658.1 hypothetical protein Mp_8g12510 [Marchantia polymorpha subsp. ruderalis]|eukprot:PTQ34109.1 hypothetical protein MARPO_0083s0069 [Marchantia polymorpha]